MVGVAHLVRASDCGSEGSRFDPDLPPQKEKAIVTNTIAFFVFEGGTGDGHSKWWGIEVTDEYARA